MNPLIFILLRAEPSGFEKMGNFIAPILSACAFILSSAAFIFTVIIQLKERKRNIRQTLTNALSEVARINVDIAKLKNDSKSSTELTKIWKNYNAQRGTLASDADFLISENEKIVTDIDCELMASTYDDIGNNEQAENYWLRAIKLASNATQKHAHQRDYSCFLFANNVEEKARKSFEATLKTKLPATDDNFSELTNTYLLWAKLERNFDNQTAFKRLIKEAQFSCDQIKHKEKKQVLKGLLAQEIKAGG